eukprot:Phypoly_transcript_12510.p1 GENE.Phypoly_transcript_12510~~Phypoly_transcript_12510.p1  ORF type:complete len:157 (+),score=9.09 Phypoly_transcript_12510:209-679(+)
MILSGHFKPFLVSNTNQPSNVDILFKHLQDTGHIANISEVVGPVNSSQRFATLYNANTQNPMKIFRSERLHKLTTVNPECLKGDGKLDIATHELFDTLVEWYGNFSIDVGECKQVTQTDVAIHKQRIQFGLEANSIFLWKMYLYCSFCNRIRLTIL